jgi:protein-S-isoprenylcysteine O-methyltransferase Ste14
MTLIGIGLALGNWASLAALVVLPTVGLVVRIRVEERALVEGLGEPYRRFAESRARLIPGVW